MHTGKPGGRLLNMVFPSYCSGPMYKLEAFSQHGSKMCSPSRKEKASNPNHDFRYLSYPLMEQGG
jgi:hypothetical protein